MRVLLIKLSSMGDMIHTLPALTDAQRAFPDVRFDWVAEENFSEIPSWHNAVANILPVAIRRWRRQPWRAWRHGDWQHTWQRLREHTYDHVIDAQGLIKSALLARSARGPCHGYDRLSIREPIAALLYHHRHAVAYDQHAVTRIRHLFASALAYPVPTQAADYGIDKTRLPKSPYSERYLVCLPNTTWSNKHWPETYWCDLVKRAEHAGYTVLLPWGNATEQQRVQRIAAAGSRTHVLPRLSLTELAGVLAHAEGVISVDTGLGHLAAALDVPTVALYGPTHAHRAGTHGQHQYHLNATFPCAPCFSRQCTYRGNITTYPACFTQLTPDLVWTTYMKGKLFSLRDGDS